jgi:hypothetical protein
VLIIWGLFAMIGGGGDDESGGSTQLPTPTPFAGLT